MALKLCVLSLTGPTGEALFNSSPHHGRFPKSLVISKNNESSLSEEMWTAGTRVTTSTDSNRFMAVQVQLQHLNSLTSTVEQFNFNS